jgi:hypothetical protein
LGLRLYAAEKNEKKERGSVKERFKIKYLEVLQLNKSGRLQADDRKSPTVTRILLFTTT